MKKVNIHQAKTQLSALLAYMEEKNETIIICRAGKPIAELTPYRAKTSRRTQVPRALKPQKVTGDLTVPVSGDWDV